MTKMTPKERATRQERMYKRQERRRIAYQTNGNEALSYFPFSEWDDVGRVINTGNVASKNPVIRFKLLAKYRIENYYMFSELGEQVFKRFYRRLAYKDGYENVVFKVFSQSESSYYDSVEHYVEVFVAGVHFETEEDAAVRYAAHKRKIAADAKKKREETLDKQKKKRDQEMAIYLRIKEEIEGKLPK